MSFSKIDEIEALLQTPEEKRDDTITNTGMTSYQQMVERIVDEISNNGVTSDEIEDIKQKMLKLPDGETKDFFKKMIDKMEKQYEKEEEYKKDLGNDNIDIEFGSGLNFVSNNFDHSSDQTSMTEALARKIRSCGEYFGNLVEEIFDVDDNGKVSDKSRGSMIKVRDVVRAKVAIYEIIDCLKSIGIRVDVSSEQENFDASQPLVYAIHFPHGFEISDIFSITSQDISRIIELQKLNINDNQQSEPNIFIQVVGNEFEQMQQSFRKFSSKNVWEEKMLEILKSLKKNSPSTESEGTKSNTFKKDSPSTESEGTKSNTFKKDSPSNESEGTKSNTWKDFVFGNKERNRSNDRGI